MGIQEIQEYDKEMPTCLEVFSQKYKGLMIDNLENSIEQMNKFEIFNERDSYEKTFYMLIKAKFASFRQENEEDSSSKRFYID